jgi:ATP-binding cassette subfamily F protein 3
MAKVQARIAEVDVALSDPAKAAVALKGMNVGKLGQMREKLEAELADAEAHWMTLVEKLEGEFSSIRCLRRARAKALCIPRS